MTGNGDDQRHGKTGLTTDNGSRLCLREIHPVRRLPQTNAPCGPLFRTVSVDSVTARAARLSR